MAKPQQKKPAVGVPEQRSNTAPILIGAGVVLLALVIIAVVLAKPWAKDKESVDEAPFQSSQITGQALPQTSDSGTDPAVGTAAPTVVGKTFTGDEKKIEPDGKPKAVMFWAHWCPHCQAELPKISDFLNDNKGKYNVDFYSIATGTSPAKPNFPPAPWFEKEKYPYPVIADDVNASIANAYGLSSYPYLVFLDGQNKVISRVSGELPDGQFKTLVEQASATKTG